MSGLVGSFCVSSALLLLGNIFIFGILDICCSLVNELPGPSRPSRRRGTDAGVRDAWVGPTPWDQEEAGI